MQMQHIRKLCISGGIVLSGLIGISLFITTLNSNSNNGDLVMSPNIEKSVKDTKQTMETNIFSAHVTFLEEDIPSSVIETSKNVAINQDSINIMGVKTFYQEANPPAGISKSGEVVVLLHGAAFTSQNWVELGTIGLLAAMGHRVIALDLPGYGKTPSRVSDKPKFLGTFLEELHIQKPFLLSPSMSGGFSVPYLINHQNDLSGYIPVAPVNTELVRDKAVDIKVPTLIIYGENDKSLGIASTNNLKNIPTSKVVMIPNANHPAYLDNPAMFHQLLYNFIKKVHASAMA